MRQVVWTHIELEDGIFQRARTFANVQASNDAQRATLIREYGDVGVQMGMTLAEMWQIAEKYAARGFELHVELCDLEGAETHPFVPSRW